MDSLNNIDPMTMVLFLFPLLVLIGSIGLQLIFKKRLVILLINFTLWLVLTFTVFNSSFLIYCFIYTVISFVGTLIGDLLINSKKKIFNERMKVSADK